MTAVAVVQQVEGFFVPIYERTDPVTGETLHGLGPADFKRVVDGYGCPKCLAKFRHYTASCILCGWTRDIAADIQAAPDYWQQSIDERENDRTPYAKPVRDPFAEMMRGLEHDRDIDHVPIAALAKKSQVRRT